MEIRSLLNSSSVHADDMVVESPFKTLKEGIPVVGLPQEETLMSTLDVDILG